MGKNNNDNIGFAHNVIAEGTLIKGEINSDGDFRIDGTIEGTITSSGRIVIGDKGIFKGTVNAGNVEIMGLAKGDINVKETLTLKSTGKIEGNIKTNTLVIEQDAQFDGTCQMGAELLNTSKEKITPEKPTSNSPLKNKKR